MREISAGELPLREALQDPAESPSRHLLPSQVHFCCTSPHRNGTSLLLGRSHNPGDVRGERPGRQLRDPQDHRHDLADHHTMAPSREHPRARWPQTSTTSGCQGVSSPAWARWWEFPRAGGTAVRDAAWLWEEVVRPGRAVEEGGPGASRSRPPQSAVTTAAAPCPQDATPGHPWPPLAPTVFTGQRLEGRIGAGRRSAHLKIFKGWCYRNGPKPSPVLARKPVSSARRYCIRLSRVFTSAVSSVMSCLVRFASDRFRCDHTGSTGLSSWA